MAKEKVNMPMSSAGILGSGTENFSKFQLSTMQVVFLILGVVVLILLMHLTF